MDAAYGLQRKEFQEILDRRRKGPAAEDAEKQAYQQYRAGVAREAKFGTFADLMKKS